MQKPNFRYFLGYFKMKYKIKFEADVPQYLFQNSNIIIDLVKIQLIHYYFINKKFSTNIARLKNNVFKYFR